jgi:predicted nucleic acid-binding protein
MVLVDTSVWIDHLRKSSARLGALLEEGQVAIHPFIIGELACGNLRNRKEVLVLLHALPQTPGIDDDEILFFMEKHSLAGRGLGLIDIHLLASSQLSQYPLWTKDKGLKAAAKDLGWDFGEA